MAAACLASVGMALPLSFWLFPTRSGFPRLAGSAVPAGIVIFWVAGRSIQAGAPLLPYDHAQLDALVHASLGPGEAVLTG